jgi:prepilin-type processing-associated H-X9-DG protein
MFKVMGMDGKEYGPVSAEQVRTWINQGRLNAQSRIKPEGEAGWQILGDLPEFAPVVAATRAPVLAALPTPQVPTKTSGIAIASLVCALFGFLIVPALAGVILGIVALVAIHKSQGRVRGTGMAIAGLCVSGIFMLFLPIMAAMLLPALARAKTKAQTVQCMNHVKQLNLALMMYATDNNNRFPAGDKWCDAIRPYTGGSTAMYQCPGEPGGRCAFSLNSSLANQALSSGQSPARTVLVFGSGDGWNQSGAADTAKPHKHDGRMVIVGFADGHVQMVRLDQINSFQWEP